MLNVNKGQVMSSEIVWLLLVGYVQCARILVVVPTPSFSHQVVFRPLTQQLARRGHSLVVLTTDPAPPHPNVTQIDLHDSYDLWRERFIKTASGRKNDLYNQMYTALDLMVEIFEKQMGFPEVVKLLGDPGQKFDLVLAEAWVHPTLALGHHFRAPVIQVSSAGVMNEVYEAMGSPGYSYLHTDFLRTRIYNLTLWEEAQELYNRYRLHQLFISFEEKEEAMLRRVFGEGREGREGGLPPLRDLKREVELVFVNVDPLWDGLRPAPPGVLHLGGLHIPPPQELPQELKAWLDASPRGVVYVSFGTNTDPALLGAASMATLRRVLGALPYDVLWRRAPPPLPANARHAHWLPQPDLLRHEKIVLFITQAGLQSLDEALRCGVPLLALPLLGDQWFNAEQIQRYGAGRRLHLDTLTDSELNQTIYTLINDKSYRENSRRLGAAMRDRPQSSLECAVWWTERVLRRRGGLRLRPTPPSPPLPLPLPLAAAALAAAVATAAALAACYCICISLLRGARKMKTA
ncbi:UDP-glycosyltransferase UGT5-like [Choristoneura fumiferana]|uniref:UDP-glycosyltransferase UGT5-like n=1 Tax=Choristoneura fumiferana TaxID=7141 RepID=UPI003D15EB83